MAWTNYFWFFPLPLLSKLTYNFISMVFTCFVNNANFRFYLFKENSFYCFFVLRLSIRGWFKKKISGIHPDIIKWYNFQTVYHFIISYLIFLVLSQFVLRLSRAKESAVSTNIYRITGPIHTLRLILFHQNVLILI